MEVAKDPVLIEASTQKLLMATELGLHDLQPQLEVKGNHAASYKRELNLPLGLAPMRA